MPDIYRLIAHGKCEDLAQQIKDGVNVNAVLALYNRSPLMCALGGSYEPNIERYRAMLLLLNAKADPLQEHPGDESWKTTFPLLKAITRRNLAQILLLIWYVEHDCRMIPFYHARSELGVSTFASYIEIQNEAEISAGKARKYAQSIEQVVIDANKVRNLFSTTERALGTLPLTAREYEAAASAYEAAAMIFKNNKDIEDTRVYSSSLRDPDSATPEELHALFKEYYREKQQDCILKQFNCYELAEKSLVIPAAIYEEQADFDYHKALLEKLMSFYAERHKEAGRLYCLRRLAEVLSKSPAKISDRAVAHAAVPVSAAGVELVFVLPGAADSVPADDSSAVADAHETDSLLATASPSAGRGHFSIFGSGTKPLQPPKPAGAMPTPAIRSVSCRA